MGTSTATIALVMTGKDLASKEFAKVDRSLSTLAKKSIGGVNLGFLGMAGAVALATDALKTSVRKAIDEQAEIGRLNASLAANVKGWDGNTTAIEERIKAGQDLAFSDGEQRTSLALLVGSTHDVSKALDIQRTAMDLARYKGIDLETATTALIKVENGQYRMLKNLGITLGDNATATDALMAVQKIAGGQAEAYGKTAAGAMDRLTVAMDNVQEEIGTLLLPALTSLADWMTNTGLPAVSDFATTMGVLLSVIGDATQPTIDLRGQAEATGLYWQITGDTINTINDVTSGLTGNLGRYKTKADLTTTSNNGLAKSFSLVAQSGAAALSDVIDEIAWLKETGYISSSKGGKGKVTAKAAGGWVGLNGPEMVLTGERGPEYVVPNHQLGSGAGTGAPVVINVQVDGRTIARIVDQQLFYRAQRKPT